MNYATFVVAIGAVQQAMTAQVEERDRPGDGGRGRRYRDDDRVVQPDDRRHDRCRHDGSGQRDGNASGPLHLWRRLSLGLGR